MKYVQLVRRRYPSRSFFFLILVLFVLDYVQAQNTPQSPCPQLFRYSFDGAEWFGLLSLTGLQLGQTIRINMNLSLRDRLPSPYPGALELFLTREKTLQNIVENKPVLYRIRFPVQQPLPRVTRILFNNQIICAGSPDSGPLVTAIKLEHTLYTQLTGQQLANQSPTPAYQIYIPESGQLGSFDIGTKNNLGPNEQNVNADHNLELPGQSIFQSLPESEATVLDPPIRWPRPPSPSQLSPETQPGGEFYDVSGTQFQGRPQLLESPSSETVKPPKRRRPTSTRRWRPLPPSTSSLVGSDIQPSAAVQRPTNQQNPSQSNTQQAHSVPNRRQSESNTANQLQENNESSSDETSKIDAINKVCGVTDIIHNVKPLVVGGEDVKRGAWPWLVAIFLNAPTSLSFQCGGNLISNRLVLTSAHCFYTIYKKYAANDVIVFMGRHNILSWDEKGWISSSVDGIYTHPDYKNDNLSFDADIALLLLKNEIRFNEYIRPVCLWPRASTTDDIEGEIGAVVGWGRNEAGQRVTATPKRIETTVVSDIQCLRSNEQFRLLTSNRTFCAGNRDGKGPCTGDSGGGMMIYRNKKWWIRGTVSASLLDSNKSSCNLNEYVIYVDVSKFLDWIKSFMLL